MVMSWVGCVGGSVAAGGGGVWTDSGKWTVIRFCKDSRPLDVLEPSGLEVKPIGGGLFFIIALVSLAVAEIELQEEVKSCQDLILAFFKAFL
jgi:hypothetical protein